MSPMRRWVGFRRRRASSMSTPLTEDDFYLSPGRVDLSTRGGAFDEWREDLARYRAHYGGSLVRPLLLEQAVWTLLAYRITSGVHRGGAPFPVRQFLLLLGVGAQKISEVVSGVSIPYRVELAPGQYFGHFGPTVIHPEARLGPGCNISQGVTIGVAGRGDRRGVPTIGARVYIGANATVVGEIEIGDDVMIGANSLVNRDVPAGCSVVGVPAEVVGRNGTSGMGLHQRPRVPGRSSTSEEDPPGSVPE